MPPPASFWRKSRAEDQHLQALRISLFDCAISMMTKFIPRYLVGGEPKRIGNHHASMSPWNAYRAKDGWVMVCAGSMINGNEFARCSDEPNLGRIRGLKMPPHVSFQLRSRPNDENWTAQYSVDECLERFNSAVIPCGPVSEIARIFSDKSLCYRKMINELYDPESGHTVRVPGALFRGSQSQGISARQIPRKNEHFEAIVSLLKARTPLRPRTSSTSKSVLDGIRVIEIGQYTTAPLAARQLGAFGADVVKIEPPGGEPARTLPPHRDDQSVFFTMSNSDKRGLVIDLRKDEGKKLLEELVKRADILIENMGLAP